MSVNHFADWTDEEYNRILNKEFVKSEKPSRRETDFKTRSRRVLEKFEIDVANLGEVQDQGLLA